METNLSWFLSFTFLLLVRTSSWVVSLDATPQAFLECFSRSQNSNAISNTIFTPNNSSFTSILQARIDNLLFTTPATPKPLAIITPLNESQVQSVIYCVQKEGLQLRIRGGGHDFEGLSYQATEPFVLLDMINFRSIDIDTQCETAWVGAGATLGELYYRISEKSGTLGFPAGLCVGDFQNLQ